jgi:MFS superfamily sulfate permease-like transporter
MNNPSSSAAKETRWLGWLPGLVAFRSYEPAWLTRDFVAGIVLATMLAPVGIAYAVASGVGAIYGLYATISCLLAYALFGPSRILVLGPDSSLATVIFGVVSPLSGGGPASRDRYPNARQPNTCCKTDSKSVQSSSLIRSGPLDRQFRSLR